MDRRRFIRGLVRVAPVVVVPATALETLGRSMVGWGRGLEGPEPGKWAAYHWGQRCGKSFAMEQQMRYMAAKKLRDLGRIWARQAFRQHTMFVHSMDLAAFATGDSAPLVPGEHHAGGNRGLA